MGNCICDNINKLVTPKIRHVYGNVLRVAIPLTLRTVEVVDGVITTSDTEFYPSDLYSVVVVFESGVTKLKYLATVDGNVVYVEDKGTIQVGTYSITVLCKDAAGNPYRFKERAVLQIVDATADAGIQEGVEYEILTNYLNAAVYFASGTNGKGIADIAATVGEDSTALTFIYVDGTTQSFNIFSGIEQIVDQDWDINSTKAIANKVVTGFRNDVVEELSERSEVIGEKLFLKW